MANFSSGPRTAFVAAAGIAAFALISMAWPRCSAAPARQEPKGGSSAPGRGVATLDVPPIQVRVTKQAISPNSVIYRYEVVNGGAFPISGLSIGNAFHLDETELDKAPMGWNSEAIPQTPASSVQSPPGWTFEFLSSEAGEPGTADWKVDRPSEVILGGTSVAGFAVVLPEQSAAYEEGHWTVYLDTNEEILYSGALQPTGVTEVPISSVFAKSDLSVTPNPSGGGVMIQFAVPVAGIASVDVFDAQGRLIRKVLRKQLVAGAARIAWDGRSQSGSEVAAGVYFVRVKTATTRRFSRVTLLR